MRETSALQTYLACAGSCGPLISHTHHFSASCHGEVLVQVWLLIVDHDTGDVTLGHYPDRMGATGRIRVARVYDDPDPDDGRRILVDRLWPRGFRKDDPRVGTWLKDVAPSKELREWYDHQPERFDQFAARYRKELHDSKALDELRKLTTSGIVTLVTATRHVEGSHASVLATLLG